MTRSSITKVIHSMIQLVNAEAGSAASRFLLTVTAAKKDIMLEAKRGILLAFSIGQKSPQ